MLKERLPAVKLLIFVRTLALQSAHILLNLALLIDLFLPALLTALLDLFWRLSEIKNQSILMSYQRSESKYFETEQS